MQCTDDFPALYNVNILWFGENIIVVFMDDFSVWETHLIGAWVFSKILKRYEDCNLMLNLEKYNFMVKECIVLGNHISEKRIEVDQAKVEVIEKLPPPIYFDESYLKAFGELKEKLVPTPINISPDWSEPFEVMCDASGVSPRIVLGQKIDKILHFINYACKSLKKSSK